MPEQSKKKYTYKYVKAITVGHKPDGKPIRKYIRENNKAVFEQKVRYYQNLNARGVQIVGRSLTVEQWAWHWYHTYKEPKIGEMCIRDSSCRCHRPRCRTPAQTASGPP